MAVPAFNASLLPASPLTTTFALADPWIPLGTCALIWFGDTPASGAAIPLNFTVVSASWVGYGNPLAALVLERLEP
jgi:hypothetical protein